MFTSLSRTCLLAFAVVLANASLESSANAAPRTGPPAQRPGSPEPALKDPAAQKKLDEARALAEQSKWADACARLEEADKLEPNLTTELKLADCYERNGRTATAWQRYKAVAEAAASGGDASKEQYARAQVTRLEPTVDKIIISPPELPGIVVEVDGRNIGAEAFRQPLPLDPGEHTMHVWAPQKASYDTLITVSGRGATIRIDVPPLEDPIPWRLTPGNTTTSVVERQIVIVREAAPPSPRSSFGWMKPTGFVVGGIGLGAIATGAILYGVAASENDPACGDNRCVPTVALVSAGAVALAFGAIFVLVGGSN